MDNCKSFMSCLSLIILVLLFRYFQTYTNCQDKTLHDLSHYTIISIVFYMFYVFDHFLPCDILSLFYRRSRHHQLRLTAPVNHIMNAISAKRYTSEVLFSPHL